MEGPWPVQGKAAGACSRAVTMTVAKTREVGAQLRRLNHDGIQRRRNCRPNDSSFLGAGKGTRGAVLQNACWMMS